MADERLAREAEFRAQTRVRDTFAHFNRELKEIDPGLELVWAGPNVTAAGLTPGRWHVIRAVAGSPPGIIVHETDEGEYRDPDSGLFERLKEGDMWNDRTRREDRIRREKLEAKRVREREHERQERVDEITERFRQKQRTQVLVK